MREWWTKFTHFIPGISISFPEENWLPLVSATGHRLQTYRFGCPRPRGVVICFHGIYSYANSLAHLAKAFADTNLAVYSLDYACHGQSEGPRGELASVEALVEDAVAYLCAVESQHPGLPVFLLGLGLGGLVANLVSLKHEGVRGMLLLSPLVGVSAKFEKCSRGVVSTVGWLFPSLEVGKLEPTELSTNPHFEAAFNECPYTYKGAMTARTANALLSALQQFKRSMRQIRTPFFLVNGNDNIIVDQQKVDKYLAATRSVDKKVLCVEHMRHEVQVEPQIWDILDELIVWVHERLSG